MRWRWGAAWQAADCRGTNLMRTVAFALNTVAALSTRQACSLLHVSPLRADLRWSRPRFYSLHSISSASCYYTQTTMVACPPTSQLEAAPLRTVLLTLRQDHVRMTAWGPSDVCPSATCPVWRVERQRGRVGLALWEQLWNRCHVKIQLKG